MFNTSKKCPLSFLLIAVLLTASFVLVHFSFQKDQANTISKGETYPDSTNVGVSERAEEYIRTVVGLMKEYAIHKQTLDFDSIYQFIRDKANDAQTINDTHSAIQQAIPMLQDQHSSFLPFLTIQAHFGLTQKDLKELKHQRIPHASKNKLDSLKKHISYPFGVMIDPGVGYLSVPSFGELYYESMRFFADSLQNLIKKLDQQPLIGWVVDLRENQGGADMPMITGLGPLLDSANIYYTLDKEGNELVRTYYRSGSYYDKSAEKETTNRMLTSSIQYEVSHRAPVAILTSRKTASAAEAVVAIFAGQGNVRIIGSSTYGVSSSNRFIVLSDYSVLNISQGYYANRHQQVYPQGIAPDIPVVAVDSSSSDEVMQVALRWITDFNRTSDD